MQNPSQPDQLAERKTFRVSVPARLAHGDGPVIVRARDDREAWALSYGPQGVPPKQGIVELQLDDGSFAQVYPPMELQSAEVEGDDGGVIERGVVDGCVIEGGVVEVQGS